MKTGKVFSIQTLVLAALLALANQSHALYTNYLDVAVGTLIGGSNYYATLSAPTAADKRALAEIKRALKDLAKPSVSVAGDYNLFFAAVAHLGDLATTPTFDDIGTNAFNLFISEAQSEYVATSGRVAALNDFVRIKRAASNQLAQVLRDFNTLGANPTNKQLGLLLGRHIYTKLTVADKLAATGEAHSGFAADSLIGGTLHYDGRHNSGDIHFTDATTGTQANNGGSTNNITYTYTRTGLNTATLEIMHTDGATHVNVKFTSAGGGTFAVRSDNNDGTHDSGSGTFTLTL